MKVRLIRDVYGEDRHGNKFIRETVRFNRGTAFRWVAGTEIEMSETSAKKYIEAGDAIEVKA